MPADLHTHTTASDGTLAPAALVRCAHAAGVTSLAVTDHDTFAGLAEADAEARRLGLTFVPGVELSTDATGREVHVLGYFCRAGGGPLAELLGEMRAARWRRIEEIVSRLRSAGAPVSLERVAAIAGDGAAGRAHVARALVEAGCAGSVSEAFELYLLPGRPGYVPRRKLHPAEAVRCVVEAGGVAVLAHPGLIGGDEIIPELVAAGLRGIEAYYPAHDPGQVEAYLALADRLGLIATGGSDFHGAGERWGDLGSVTVPDDVVGRLAEAAGRKGE